jgi:hypothetical protein
MLRSLSVIWNNCRSKFGSRLPAFGKSLYKYLISFGFGIILTVFLKEYVTLYAQKVFQSKKITYEVMSVNRYSKGELTEIAAKQSFDGQNTFMFSLDDPFLVDYYLVKVRVTNKGPAIQDGLRLSVRLGHGQVKILDGKYKVNFPKNKVLQVVYTLPPFVWGLPESRGLMKAHAQWDPTPHAVGFNVYRSFNKAVGYGRLNDRLTTKNRFDWSVDLKTLTAYYYRMVAVGGGGHESSPGKPIMIPDALAFMPLFRNVVYVDPKKTPGRLPDGSSGAPFATLADAIKIKA